MQLLRPEVERHAPWWSWTGAVCGAGLGFIVANVPGLMVGAYAGNRLGAVRDAKGKSVAAVFTQLGGDQKAQVCINNKVNISSVIDLLPLCLVDSACPGCQGLGFSAVMCSASQVIPLFGCTLFLCDIRYLF